MQEITKNLLPQLTKVISDMATAMGIAAEHLYTILVRQMFAEAVGGLIVSGFWWIAVAAIAFGLTKMWRFLRADEKIRNSYNSEGFFAGAVVATGVGVILSAFVVVFNVSYTADNVIKLMNPEYYALERILEKVKGIK